jgi:hypothetical protein
MSDEEIIINNSMDIDIAPNESSSSPAPATSTVILDIGSGYISGSDDEDITEPATSKSSTPDSTTLPITVTKKPLTTSKRPLTKSSSFLLKNISYRKKNTSCYFLAKSSLVNYERDSDDDEHTDEEEQEDDNEEQDGEDDQSNSNSAPVLHGVGELDSVQIESTTYTEQTIVTSDLLNVTPVFIINFNHLLFIYFCS